MKKTLLFIFAFFIVSSTFAQENDEFNWNSPMLGKKAPALKVKEWLTEKPDTTGKFIILDFWATFCGPCVKFTPYMNEFAKKFKKDVVFIAIATQSKESVEKGIKDIQIGNLYFCLPYPDTCISDSQSVTYQPVFNTAACSGGAGQLFDSGRLNVETVYEAGRILEHADRHDSGDFLDASWVD